MGLIRKSLSVGSAGLIDFRSDKERAARNARLTKQATNRARRAETRQSRTQAELLAEQNRLLAEQNALLAARQETGEGQ